MLKPAVERGRAQGAEVAPHEIRQRMLKPNTVFILSVSTGAVAPHEIRQRMLKHVEAQTLAGRGAGVAPHEIRQRMLKR